MVALLRQHHFVLNMDLRTRRHSGMILQLAVLLWCSHGAIGKGEHTQQDSCNLSGDGWRGICCIAFIKTSFLLCFLNSLSDLIEWFICYLFYGDINL